jgi:L-histidine Nalpha-methyltransferase
MRWRKRNLNRNASEHAAPDPAIAHEDPAATRAELIAGLSAPQAALSPQISLRRARFAPVCRDHRTARVLPDAHRGGDLQRQYMNEMAEALGPVATLVDLGAGNCEKAARLFAGISQVQRYVAVDISADYLRESLDRPAIRASGAGDARHRPGFLADAASAGDVGPGPRTLFYPGSSIGNFTPDEALVFLRQVHAASQGGNLLIGVDLVKPDRDCWCRPTTMRWG